MLRRQRSVKFFCLIFFSITIGFINTENVEATVNEDGRLQINSDVLQQKKESHQSHGVSSKAAKDVPDLFDPKYSKGLNKEKQKQTRGNKKSQENVFAKKKPQVDLDAKENKKVSKNLFTNKKISTSAGTDQDNTNSSFDIKGFFGIAVLLVACISIGIFLGFKGQKLIFRRSKNG